MRTEEIEQAIERLDRSQRLQLIEMIARSLQREEPPAQPLDKRANLRRLKAELAEIPPHNPDDGFSNRDHDALIYGERR